MTEPSRQALESARDLARTASKSDKWMEPDLENLGDDYGEFTDTHQAGWEETEHFRHYYGRELDKLANQEAERLGFSKLDDWDKWYYALYVPLKDAFWDEWEEKVGLDAKWEEARKDNRL